MVAAIKKNTLDLTHIAMKGFLKYWEENATEADVMSMDDGEFRNAQTAMEMLYHYIEDRRPLLTNRDFELLAIERPFAVPLSPDDPNLIYIGRWDKVFRWQGKIFLGEHKTTASYKKNGPFRNDFVESFSPNSQIDGYLFAGMVEYGKEVKACWVDAALVHRDIHDGFRFLPVERQFAQIETWLWEVQYWISQVEGNKEVLRGINDPHASYLAAFPKNTVSCTQYGGCPYIDLCKSWSNPADQQTPLGFIKEKWEPFEELKIARGDTAIVRVYEGGMGEISPANESLYDNTRVQEFRTCPRKFYYRHMRDWRPQEDRRPLLFGGAWHAAMDIVWEVLADRTNKAITTS
jgi:hypothetical protein